MSTLTATPAATPRVSLVKSFPVTQSGKRIRPGMGATLVYVTDGYPYIVTRVSPTGSVLTLAPIVGGLDRPTETPGEGGYGVQTHTYTRAELADAKVDHARARKAHRDSRGRYHAGGTRVVLGTACKRVDYRM